MVTTNELLTPFKEGWRKILKGIAAGLIVKEKLNNPEIEAFRRKTCNQVLPIDAEGNFCNNRDTKADLCKVCGCFLDLKISSKTNFDPHLKEIVITHCPKGYWHDKEIAEHYDKKKIKSKN